MRKIILTILICGFMVLGITGCGVNKNEFDIGKESDVKIIEKDVSLSVKKNTLTKTSATLILKNDRPVEIQYGEPYEIEIKENGKWHKINVELAFNLPAYILKAKSQVEIKLDWENAYGKLASGDYRIIKSFDIKNVDDTYEKFYITAEFTIK